MNPDITWEIVKDNPDKTWNWYGLSMNPNITCEILKDNPDQFLYYRGLSRNTFLYEPIVNKRHKTKDINFRYNIFKNIFEHISPFSRNIDRIIKRRLNYNII
jgi:hypothetical protein